MTPVKPIANNIYCVMLTVKEQNFSLILRTPS